MPADAAARLQLSPEEARELARSTPAGFAFVASGGKWIPAKHLQMVSERIVAIARREINRLMIFQPPRSGKSQLVSEYTPPWYLGRFPDRRIILASYGASLASTWGRKSRDLLTEWGPEWFDGITVDAGSSAADRWDIAGRRGGMVTAGIGGPLTGRGADLFLIDDPIKDAEEAASEVIRAKHIDWYRSVARTRLMPQGAVVLMQTRWNEDDLAGQLLADMATGGEQWEVISLPAIAEEDDQLGREPGEALWPHMFPLEVLEETRRAVGSYFFAALYQQRPAPPEGFMFKRKNLRYWRAEVNDIGGILQRLYVLSDEDGPRKFDMAPTPRFQTVDAAISEKETADYTVVATWAVTEHKDLILLDLERRHFEEQQVAEFLKACADKHGRPPMWVERFGAGRNPLRILQRDGYPVHEIPAEAGTQTDKITRAFGAVAVTERHKLFLPYGAEWLGKYESELASFPHAKHDDQVDVTAYAARLLPIVTGSGRARAPEQPPHARPISAGIEGMRF